MAFEVMVPLHEAIEEVAADNDTWTVILTGEGRGFCSGAATVRFHYHAASSNGGWKMRHLFVAAVLFLVACSGGDTASEKSPSGLVITHVVEGTGPSPTGASVVKVHYHGTFQDGTVFDSSVERNQPASFPLRRVIRCWTMGLQQMKVGGKATLTCPPALAYGERGAPPRIPPNATLTFEVELLGIQ